MRLASKRVLLAVMAISALAVTVPSAFANPVQVVDEEGTPAHCVDLGGTAHDPSGGCEFHALGTFILFNHEVSMEPFAVCTLEFTANVDEDGRGEISLVEIVGPGACPFIDPCEDIKSEAPPWDISLETLPDDTIHAVLHICFDTPIGQCAGDYEVKFNTSEPQIELYNFGSGQNDTVGIGPCEVQGHWAVESEDADDFHIIPAP